MKEGGKGCAQIQSAGKGQILWNFGPTPVAPGGAGAGAAFLTILDQNSEIGQDFNCFFLKLDKVF